jgi:hypothetical protein
MNAVAQWIALVDAAEEIMHPLGIWGPEHHQQMCLALEALRTQEHAMADGDRETARRRLWQRDHPDEPLPADAPRLRQCTCPSCLFVRRLGRHRQAVPSASVVKPASSPQPEASQGALFPCF